MTFQAHDASMKIERRVLVVLSRLVVVLAMGAALLGTRAFAEDAPADILRAAKERMHGKPWKVEALVQGEKGFKVAGVIGGKDFDLTVQTARGSSRQIAIGEQSWSSEDNGRTWKKGKTTDRRYYFLTHAPISYRPDEKVPSFEKVATSEEDREQLAHIRFIAPEKVAYEGDRPNHWIAMRVDKPIAIRRYAGPLVFEKDYVTAQVRYTPLDDANPSLPPPGNPRALPASDTPDAVLSTALRQMKAGLWEVEATITTKKEARLHGLIEGRDFDLAMEPDAEGTPIRMIAIKDKAWGSYDRGKTWKQVSAEDRLIHSWVYSPLLSGGMLPAFETVGREEHGDETWLHICLKISEKLASEKERPHYWLALGAEGQPPGVRRYEGNLAYGDQVIYCAADYRPASKGAAIKPPAASATRTTGLPPPIDETLGFFDIERQKLQLAGQVVRVEITGKTLSAETIGGDMVRVMVKDTAQHYGLVEFPRAGLEKLGINKSYSGKPVALFLLITPQGEKPAAKATAVGSKFIRGDKGQGSYEW